jgi:hypothetical protein
MEEPNKIVVNMAGEDEAEKASELAKAVDPAKLEPVVPLKQVGSWEVGKEEKKGCVFLIVFRVNETFSRLTKGTSKSLLWRHEIWQRPM